MTAEIYWIKDVPGGRLAILARPRAGDWLADEIADWKAAGLTDVVSLLEEHEIRETGLLLEAQLAREAGMSFESFPIPDRGVPSSVSATHRLWASLEDNASPELSMKTIGRRLETRIAPAPDRRGARGRPSLQRVHRAPREVDLHSEARVPVQDA